jgi:hypothetical protein
MNLSLYKSEGYSVRVCVRRSNELTVVSSINMEMFDGLYLICDFL